jgi:hypothetical protein
VVAPSLHPPLDVARDVRLRGGPRVLSRPPFVLRARRRALKFYVKHYMQLRDSAATAAVEAARITALALQ